MRRTFVSLSVVAVLATPALAAPPAATPAAARPEMRITLDAKARPLGALLRELEGLVHPELVVVDKAVENVPVTVTITDQTPAAAFSLILKSAGVPYGIWGEKPKDLRVVTGEAGLLSMRVERPAGGSAEEALQARKDDENASENARLLMLQGEAEREAASRPDLSETFAAGAAAAMAARALPPQPVEVPYDADPMTAALINGANAAAAQKANPGTAPQIDPSSIQDPVVRAMMLGAAGGKGQAAPSPALDPNTVQDPVARALILGAAAAKK